MLYIYLISVVICFTYIYLLYLDGDYHNLLVAIVPGINSVLAILAVLDLIVYIKDRWKNGKA